MNQISLSLWCNFSFVDITSYIGLHTFVGVSVVQQPLFNTKNKTQENVALFYQNGVQHLQIVNSTLELQAAVMATCLKVSLIEEIKENTTKIFLQTDSKVVVNYLRNEDRNFGVFVAHRVNEIRSHMTFNDQRQVPNAHAGKEHTSYLLRNKFWIRACRGIRKTLSN